MLFFDAKGGVNVVLKEPKYRYTNSFYLSHCFMFKDIEREFWKDLKEK